ncbi:MAG: nuclear transport factor 2 family protein [Puniceicoccaceae bacterium]|nr:nuclear transport factor 2 family protein [Puniceicoccaceae bacterium]
MIQTKTILTLLLVSATLLLTACTTTPEMHTQTIPNSEYRQALAATDPAQFVLPAPGSEAEQAMLGPVKALFSDYSRDNLTQNVTEVYAEDVYFRDAFKEFKKATDIRDYMLEGLKPLEKAEFVFNRVARSGGDYYLDWTMRLDFKKTPSGTWEESIGVSHMRFNSEGKVIFHQDYWDPTDIVYRRIPIAKQLIAFVKGQM